jgi:adenylate cyclase
MNRYMTAIAEPILDNEGCLIKFIGDASLHVHGAPLDDARHAARAVVTGLAMLRAVENFNQELALENRPPVGMGVGINTGPTLIGNIGSKTRFGYDVLGDTVSLASRLEGQTKPYGVKIILGPLTAEQVKDEYFVLELDKIAVKGKKVGVNIFTVLELYPGAHGEYEMGRGDHEEMLAAYRNREFEHAIFLCDSLIGEFDGQMDSYYAMWKDRCKEMKLNKLPQDWDGTYVSTSK